MENIRPARRTIEMVAKEAGVSIATVSRVLNNKNNVSTKAREKVLNAMHRLGYAAPTRNLIGLILPDSSNPFFSHLGFTFEQVFEKEGKYHLLISSSEGRPDREFELVDRFKGLGVKGLIYITSGNSLKTLLSIIADGTLPVVVFDRKVKAGNLDFVAVNSRQGTLCAVDYLIAHGHQRIAYLKGLPGTETAKERYDSFREAMQQNNLEINENLVFSGNYRLSAGRACAEHLLTMPDYEKPTALLAANDLMAIGVMQKLLQHGWILPQMLSIIGFDNIHWSEWTYPALTTISQPISTLVLEAVKLLTDRIKEMEDGTGERTPPKAVEIEPVLIPRDSVTEPFEHHVHNGLQAVSADARTWSE